jgi:hypothetical protein
MCPTPASQPAAWKVSAAKPIYFMTQWFRDIGGVGEIMKAENVDAVTSFPWGSMVIAGPAYCNAIDPQTGVLQSGAFWSVLNISTIARNTLYGGPPGRTYTDAMYAAGVGVWDITIIVNYAKTILARFRQGCEVFTIKTPLHTYEVQQTDLVTVTTPDFLAKGFDGITSSTKWEIISKEIDIFAGEITWKLAHAQTATPTVTAPLFGRKQISGKIGPRETISGGFISQATAANGLAVTQTSGLIGSVAMGTLSAGYSSAHNLDAWSRTFTANKDTYVIMNATTGILNFPETANGAGAPPITGGGIWLAKVVTNGSTITGITDMRETKPMLGSNLKAGTGPLTNLSTAGVLGTNGIAAESITTSKVGPNAIGAYQQYGRDIRSTINIDPYLLHYNRG